MKILRKKSVWRVSGIFIGLTAGVLMTFALTRFSVSQGFDSPFSGTITDSESTNKVNSSSRFIGTNGAIERTDFFVATGQLVSSNSTYPEWSAKTVYIGGDKVIYQNRIYKAKWWTQGEKPGKADVWEDTMESPSPTDMPGLNSGPIDAPAGHVVAPEGFKVVGYFPSWKPAAAENIRYDVLTHVIYAFAIPTAEGNLQPLENGETARAIIRAAHAANVKVLLAVGGWSYNDIPLEDTFLSATGTVVKREKLIEAILAMCDEYGFDGIDMDWEHPRVDGSSAGQYEALMLALANELHERGKVLTSAVLSGVTADGNIYYDAAAHSDAVLKTVDWIHVMAYDGGDGDRHSQYAFAVQSAEYWRDKRGMPASKVVLGVPFYARPSWASYGDILSAAPDAWRSDNVTYNGMQVWYNGVNTIKKKTRYALESLGGVMIWEISQDTNDRERSLITAIGSEVSAAEKEKREPSDLAFKDVSQSLYYYHRVKWVVE